MLNTRCFKVSVAVVLSLSIGCIASAQDTRTRAGAGGAGGKVGQVAPSFVVIGFPHISQGCAATGLITSHFLDTVSLARQNQAARAPQNQAARGEVEVQLRRCDTGGVTFFTCSPQILTCACHSEDDCNSLQNSGRCVEVTVQVQCTCKNDDCSAG
jgi:hypothetical protein